MNNDDVRKITILITTQLLERLVGFVLRQQRCRFIAKAIDEKLAQLEQIAALDEMAGVWTDENHPEMLTESDIDHWLSQLRSRTTGLESVSE